MGAAAAVNEASASKGHKRQRRSGGGRRGAGRRRVCTLMGDASRCPSTNNSRIGSGRSLVGSPAACKKSAKEAMLDDRWRSGSGSAGFGSRHTKRRTGTVLTLQGRAGGQRQKQDSCGSQARHFASSRLLHWRSNGMFNAASAGAGGSTDVQRRHHRRCRKLRHWLGRSRCRCLSRVCLACTRCYNFWTRISFPSLMLCRCVQSSPQFSRLGLLEGGNAHVKYNRRLLAKWLQLGKRHLSRRLSVCLFDRWINAYLLHRHAA